MKLPMTSMGVNGPRHVLERGRCGLMPSRYEPLALECDDCKITCEALRDPGAIERCLDNCNRPGGPCDYLSDLQTE